MSIGNRRFAPRAATMRYRRTSFLTPRDDDAEIAASCRRGQPDRDQKVASMRSCDGGASPLQKIAILRNPEAFDRVAILASEDSRCMPRQSSDPAPCQACEINFVLR